MINKLDAMVERHNANMITMEGTGYKAIAAAIQRTSGVKLAVTSGTVQQANKRLKAEGQTIVRNTLLVMRAGVLMATNNRHIVNAAAKGVLK